MDEEKKEEGEDDFKKAEEENYTKPVEDNQKTEQPKEVFKNNPSLTDKLRANPFMLSTIVLGVLSMFLLISMTSGGITGNVVSEEVAGENVLAFASSQLSNMEILNIEKEDGFYKIEYTSEETGESVIYATLDGEYLVSGLIPLVVEQDDEDESSQEIPKSDRPLVELFVMTHCPYGTQAEKGMIPVIEVLGDTIDAKIRFVHYFMHEPEETETPRQVCIREEQSEKWLTYLRCFLEDGDADRCLLETGIDKSALDDCIDNRAEEYYAEDSELSENAYGVGGSPTLVVNGVDMKINTAASRAPSALLDTICSAFNQAPSECELELDTNTPIPMWGWEATGSSSAGQC